jgi:predicted transcriptional regulator
VTTSDAEPSKSTELAAEIVAAFVANNSLPIAEVPALIHSVHDALARLASGQVNTAPLVEKQEPAVSVRKALTPDYLVCLDDGTYRPITRWSRPTTRRRDRKWPSG